MTKKTFKVGFPMWKLDAQLGGVFQVTTMGVLWAPLKKKVRV